MHLRTIIRHTKTSDGFAVVVTGRFGEGANLQEYAQTDTPKSPHTSLVSDVYYSDERTACDVFDKLWFAKEVGL